MAFFAAAAVSVPFALSAFLISWRVRPFSRALAYAGVGVAVLVVGLAAIVATISVEAGVVVAAVAIVAGAVLWALPLFVARTVLIRRGLDRQRALRTATAGLPVAMIASLFVAFGDFSGYNITFLTGVKAVLAWIALVVIVFLGPAIVGVAIASLRT